MGERGRVTTCVGRIPDDGDIFNYGQSEQGATPAQEANGRIMTCQIPKTPHHVGNCPGGYTFQGWCNDHKRCQDKVSDPNCGGIFDRKRRAVCKRDWNRVMDGTRIEECCDGRKTTPFDCKSEYCPNSEACFTFLSGRCSDPANVESKGCQRFCDENPVLCANAIRTKCVGDAVASEFCRTRCKTVDCRTAYNEYCNKAENKDKGFCKCFLTAEFATFQQQMKTAFGANTTVLPQCGFAGCAGNRESTELLLPTPIGAQRNLDCPAQCNQQIISEIKDSDIRYAEIINKCVIGKSQTPQTPEEKKAADDAARRAADEAKRNPPPGQNVDDVLEEDVMEEAEREAAKRARKKWIIIGAAAAVGALLLILALIMLSRSRKRKAAAAATLV